MAIERVSLSSAQLQTPAGTELHQLCQLVKADGTLPKDGIVSLRRWLRKNQSSDLPAVPFLTEVVERIVQDKVVSSEELRELHLAIEKVLPPKSRKAIAERRKALESAEKRRKKEEMAAAKEAEKVRRTEERERLQQERANRPTGFHSKVYGTTQRNADGNDRQQIIRDYVRTGMRLIIKREPDNSYDEWAISLWIEAKSWGVFTREHQIGYINSDVACDLAPYLDQGGWATITVKDVTGGGDRNYGVNIFIQDGRDEV